MIRYPIRVLLLVGIWMATLTPGRNLQARDEIARPNVLVLVSDDQRADSIGAYGNKIIETPNIDRLAREGSFFTRAVCGNPICTPSRAEIMTGCSGFRNGVVDFGGTIDPALTKWAQATQNAGYQTWYVGKWHNDATPHDHGYQATKGWYRGGGGKWYE
ncbi:MAG: choline-sulfatase [Pirellulaceae bacterium]|jgi:choline-sulfatase